MSPITTQTYRFLHDDDPAAPKPAEAEAPPTTAPSTARARRPKRKNIFARLRSLVVAPSAPTPEPPPAPIDTEPVPRGMVRLNGELYRLPRATNAKDAAHDLSILAEIFGTPDEMRRFGVPEEDVQRHIPKPPAPVVAKAPAPLPPLARTVWPARSTALAAGVRPVAGSRVCEWSEVLGACLPALVERVVDCYAPAGAEMGSPDAYSFVHALPQGLSPRAPGHWARYNPSPVKLAQLGFKDVVWSWHRLADHADHA
jgi:hypothetical protein